MKGRASETDADDADGAKSDVHVEIDAVEIDERCCEVAAVDGWKDRIAGGNVVDALRWIAEGGWVVPAAQRRRLGP